MRKSIITTKMRVTFFRKGDPKNSQEEKQLAYILAKGTKYLEVIL